MVFAKKKPVKTDQPAPESVQDGYSVATDLYSTAANLGGIGLRVLHSAFESMDTAQVPHNWKQSNGMNTNEKVVEWTHKTIGRKPRLIRVKGTKDHMSFAEVDNRRDNMNDGDVFILDTSEIIYQWYGKDSSVEERNAANNFVKKLIRSRGPTTQGTILEQEGNKDDCPGFWNKIRAHPRKLRDLTPNGIVRGYHVQASSKAVPDESVPVFHKKLYPLILGKDGKVRREGENAAERFLENHGLKQKLRATSSVKENDNKFDRALLESSKAYILDDGKTLWVWVGLYTHIKEEDALEKATQYLERKHHHFLHSSHDRPLSLPILLIREGKEPREFRENFFSVNRDSSNAAYYQDDII